MNRPQSPFLMTAADSHSPLDDRQVEIRGAAPGI